MKKIIALVLTAVMTLSLALPAAAVLDADYNVPTILIRGDGSDIVNAEGETIWPVAIGDEEGDTSEIVNSVAKVLLPHFPTGLLTGNWDAYYEAFYQEMLKYFGDTRLDGNGEPVSKGSQIGPWFIQDNENSKKTDKKRNGRYDYSAYVYHYDFRLSPFDHMKELDEYIMAIMNTTKAKQVNLVGRCLGGGFLMCYLDYYVNKVETTGCAPYLKNVMFQATVHNDCSPLSDSFSGNIALDGDALQRFLHEYIDTDKTTVDGVLDTAVFLNDVILTSYNLLNEVGVVDILFIKPLEDLYEELYAGLTPKLLEALMGTWAGYWTAVDTNDFDTALELVYGKQGSEKRTEYAGLVDKLIQYDEQIAARQDEIFDKCEALGVHFGVLAKYGYQMYPFVKSQDMLADSMVTLESSAFGATTAKVGETLSDKYIAERIALGYGDYISADKQVDLSTARFKDTTYVIKNLHHDNWTPDRDIINNFVWSTNLTTDTDTVYSRFMVYNDETEKLEKMTEENCNVSQWGGVEDKKESTLITKLMALFKWLKSIFQYIINGFSKPEATAPAA